MRRWKNGELVAYLACHPDGVSDDRIRTVVGEETGVKLETEVRIVGNA